jgi:hypothetical protein
LNHSTVAAKHRLAILFDTTCWNDLSPILAQGRCERHSPLLHDESSLVLNGIEGSHSYAEEIEARPISVNSSDADLEPEDADLEPEDYDDAEGVISNLASYVAEYIGSHGVSLFEHHRLNAPD